MAFNTVPFNPFPPSSDQQGEGGTQYELPIAGADTLGGVKVGDGLEINAETGVLSNPHTPAGYSTDEVATGEKWIDNKDIYRKVYSVNALPNTTTLKVDTGLSNVNVVRVWGTVFGNNTKNPLPFISTSAAYSIECWVDSDNKITITSSADYSSYNAVVVLEYTKITT